MCPRIGGHEFGELEPILTQGGAGAHERPGADCSNHRGKRGCGDLNSKLAHEIHPRDSCSGLSRSPPWLPSTLRGALLVDATVRGKSDQTHAAAMNRVMTDRPPTVVSSSVTNALSGLKRCSTQWRFILSAP